MGSTPLTKQVCPQGYFCPEATKRASQYPCPSGTFNPLSGQKSLDACRTCPAGSFCEQGSANSESCPRGYFCLEGTTSADQYPCPAGTFSGPQTGLTVASQCLQCEIGSYCPEASSTPQKCPAGMYNPNVGSAGLHECLDCPPGWSCPQVGQSAFTDRCVPGHYCPSGTVLARAKPCPAGTYTERVDLIRAEDCTICPLRHACPQGTGGETQTMLDCDAGFFCPNGTAFAKQFPCLPGSWSSSTSLADASECEICPKGKYCAGGKSFIDGNCSAGYYCPLGTASPTKFPCPSGTYTSKTWLFEPSQCDDCPPGYYCPAGSVDPIPCKPGSYTSLNKTQSVGPGTAWPSCITCPAGYFCVEGEVAPEPCGKGKFSTAGSKTCSLCEAGCFCNSVTTSDTNMRANIVSWASPGALYGKCYNGTYCPPGSDSEPALETDACPRGYYCPTATPQPIVCPAGTYSNFTGQDALDDCVPTPAGQYSLEGALQPTGECSPGFYCPIRSTSKTQVPCPARYYLNRTAGRSEEDCAVCVTGSYCPKGSAYPIPCPPGSYCRTGVAVPESCPIGTYANSSGLRQVEDCLMCSPGMYCDSTGLTVPRGPCDPGYYCTSGAYTSAPMNYESTIFGVSNKHTGAQCPQGAYCPLGSATPTLCPLGTFNNFTGLEGETQCVSCPAGLYCETPGLFLPTGSCYAGYFCTGGSSVATQNATPAGFYSLTGATSPTPCPLGQFNLHPMQNQCVDCPAGFYCNSPATIQPAMCPKGSYCPKSTSLPVKCPPGTYSGLEGLVAVNQCEPCPAGFYCDSYGLSVPSGKCFEGFVCTQSSPVANPVNQTFGQICPAGYYCPEGSGAGVQCPNGTFRASIGGTSLNSCTSCPGGLYCEGTALTTPTDTCREGYFCVSQASSATPSDTITGDICPAGFYCRGATITPVKCAAGTYTVDPGQSICITCPERYFCDGISTDRLLDCPTGHYCPNGTGAFPVPCPMGTFSNRTKIANARECQPCTLGFYCETEGLAAPSGVCASGYYCPIASENKFGKNAMSLTLPCPVGAYCPEGTYIPAPCPRGTYSNASGLASATQCTFCEEGSFCADLGITRPTGLCSAGFYCKRNNTEPTPSTGIVTIIDTTNATSSMSFGGNRCPLGNYCSAGSIFPRPCPEGTFADELGTAVCKPCVPGFFCPLGTIDYATNQCPRGYYCPEGTKGSVEFPCPPGTFGNVTGLQALLQCNSAPGGMYVDGFAAIQPTGTCKSGFYCTGGSASSTPSLSATGGPCLPGTNCPEGSAVPIVCDAGSYCSSTNTDRALPCDQGFYCVQGSYTANPTGQNNSLGIIGDVCSAGHYCPQGTSNPIPCPPGTFSENTQNTQAADCFPCPPGFLCSVSGIVTPFEKCPPGFICTGGEREATQRCPKGSECPEGSSQPTVCPAGTFSDEEGLAKCRACPQRYFCEQGTVVPKECPSGCYCPPQTPSASTFPCLAGTFSNQTKLASALECTKCPLGKFCSEDPPTSSPTGECAPGYFCSGGARTPKPLDGPTGGLCTGGFMCFGGAWLAAPADNRTGRACDAGFYCPMGSAAQIRCPKGTYNSFESQVNCTTCPAGSYCDTNSTAPSPCPLKYYCPSGTVEPILCPSGTFGHQSGLESADQCAACRAGKYCTGGVETASCAAGYYCKLYNQKPNPATRVNASLVDLGGPCPVGHYCPEGVLDPIPCPNSTARLVTLGTSVDDCGPCPAGMSCEDGAVTVSCPRGSYCPLGESAISCPIGTYNPSEGKKILENCLPCDSGKLCNRTGVINPIGYDCPPGYFCLTAETNPKPCPTGRFRRNPGGKSADDCQTCVGGSYCVLGSIEPTVCESTTYCPKGSGLPVTCPGGSYCPFNSTSPVLCPGGYFCPMAADRLTLCDRGYYCPAGTTAQIPCPLGYIGRETPLSGVFKALGESCESCPPGTFGVDPNRTKCEICLEGYVCLGATTSSRPVSKETENGYQCPPGYYCPAGSSRELACPSGTYQPELSATNSSFCRECPANAYQNAAGQASCLPCSKSAFSSAGATKCTCIGSHRAFQMTDGYCICEPGYEFYDQDLILRSDEDDDVDCQPIVYDRCGSNQVRSESGSCMSVSTVSCEKSCNNGTGTYVSSLGLCQCDQQPDLDLICDKKCRDSSMQLQVNSTTGELQLYDPVTGWIEALQNADAAQGIVSKVSCTTSNCQLHSLTIQASGFSGSYDVPSSLSGSTSSSAKRRRLTTDTETSIPNPMMCLNVGSGVIFDLSAPGSYPIYLKDSMLNTNPSFDYGAFRSLATKAKSNASSVTAFAFSFTEPGTYVFGNSLNGAAKTVIVILNDGTSCPTDGPIVPMNEKNLISVSAKRRTDDIILAPDWGLIFGLLGGLFGMVAAIITGLYYFRTKSWTNSSLRKQLAGYRAKNKQVDLASVHSKGSLVANKTATVDSAGAPTKSTAMVLDDDTDARSPHATEKGQDVYQADLGRWDDEDLDIRELVDRFQFHHESVAKCFEDQKGDVKKITQQMQTEAAELKRLFVSALLSSAKNSSTDLGILPSEQESLNPEVTTEQLVNRSDVAQPAGTNDAKTLERNGFLLENLERELMDRQRYEKKKAGAMGEVKQLLDEVESWRQSLPELTAALVNEMALNLDTQTDQPETTAASASKSFLEKVQSTLGDLESVLSSDPPTRTSSSIIQVVEGEKVRREIGAFVLEESQRHLHSLQHSTTENQSSKANEEMKALLDLHDAVAKAQNREEEAVHAQMVSLHKFGVVVPKVALALSDLERDFKAELLKLKEEQNPSKERALKLQLEGKLSKLLGDLAKGAAKVGENVQKESSRVLKCERVSRDSETQLAIALETAKLQFSRLQEYNRAKAIAEVQGRQASQNSKRQQDDAGRSALEKTRDETLFQIKDLLVALMTELNARSNQQPGALSAIGNLQTSPALAALNLTKALTSRRILDNQDKSTSTGSPTSALLGTQSQLGDLRKRAEFAAVDLADNQASMQQQYLHKLEADFPQLLPEERERLVGEFSTDLQQLTSSLNVETIRSQEDLRGMLIARVVAQEKQQQAIETHAAQQESELLQQQQVQETQLEDQFKQQELAIEQEYLQELSRLEQEFEMIGSPDFNELPEAEEGLEGDFAEPSEDQEVGYEEELSGNDEGLVDDDEDSDIDTEVIVKLCSTYADAWKDHLTALASEEAWRKKQLAARLQQKRAAYKATSSQSGAVVNELDFRKLNQNLAVEEAQELDNIRETMSLKKDALLEDLAMKQDAMDSARERAISDAVDATKQLLKDFVGLQTTIVQQRRAHLADQTRPSILVTPFDATSAGNSERLSKSVSGPVRESESSPRSVLSALLDDQRAELASFLSEAEKVSIERANDAVAQLASANERIQELRRLHSERLRELDQFVANVADCQGLSPRAETDVSASSGSSQVLQRRDLTSAEPAVQAAIGVHDRVRDEVMETRQRDFETAEGTAVEASVQLEAANASLEFVRERVKNCAAQGDVNQIRNNSHSLEVVPSNLATYNAMTEHLPALIQDATASQLERLVQELEAACRDRKQRLQAEEAAQKAKLAERMEKRKAELRNRTDLSSAEAEQLSSEINTDEQQELAAIATEYERRADELADKTADGVKELTSKLKTKCDDTAQGIEDRLRECRQQYETEAQKRAVTLELEHARAKQALLDRLRRKPGQSVDGDTGKDSSAVASPAETEAKSVAAAQCIVYDAVLRQLDADAAQRLQQAQSVHSNLQNDLKRVKNEHETALQELQAAMDAERARQELRLQQRMQQRREQQLKRNLSPREATEAEAVLAKQEETEVSNLRAQLDAQSEAAIAEEKSKQQEEEEAMETKLRLAAVEIAAVKVSREAVLALQQVAEPGTAIAPEASNSEVDSAKHKRRVAAQLALAKKSMRLCLPVSLRSPKQGELSQAGTSQQLASDPLQTAIASEVENQILKISEAHIRAWETRKEELTRQEALQKVKLAERMRQKQAKVLSSGASAVGAESADGDNEVAGAEVEAAMRSMRFQLDADLDKELDFIAAAVENAVSTGVSDLEQGLLACRAAYERDLNKLYAGADLDRQRECSALEKRLAAKRAGKSASSSLSGPNAEADEQELREELTRLEEKLAAKETALVAALQMRTKDALDDIVANAKSKAHDRFTDAQSASVDTEDELSRLRKAHGHGMTELTSSLAAERKRQEDKMLERLAKRRAGNLKDAKASDEQALVEQEQTEKERLDATLSVQAARALKEAINRFEAQKDELETKLRRQRMDVEAAAAACSAVQAGGDAELERLRREYFEGKARADSELGDAAAANKQRLAARLAGKLRKLRPADNANLESSSGDEAVAVSKADHANGLMDASADALLDTIQSLQDVHYRTWKQLQERLDDEGRLRRAQLADRLKRKRAELQSKAASGALSASEFDNQMQALAQEEQIQTAMITTEMTEKVAQLRSAVESQKQSSADALANSFADSSADIDRLIDECKQQHKREKQKLRGDLDLERQRQQQSLKHRIAKRRERVKDDSESSEDASKAEEELDELDAQEQSALESNLKASEAMALVANEELYDQQILGLTRSLEQDAGKNEADAKWKEQMALDELARVTREHQEQMRALREAMDAEKQRKMLELAERLQKRRNQRLRDVLSSGASDVDAQSQVEAEERLAQLALEDELSRDNAVSILSELEQQRVVEQQLSDQLSQASIDAARAEVARKAVEAAQTVETNRIQEEFQKRRKELAEDDSLRQQAQTTALQVRLAARKHQQKQQRSTTPENDTTASTKFSLDSASPTSPRIVAAETDTSMEDEVQRVKDAHEVGWQARINQLELDAAMKKARLIERMQKKRTNLHSSSSAAAVVSDSKSEPEAVAEDLRTEETEALAAIDADFEAQRAQLQSEMEDEQRALRVSLDATARDKAAELERLLAECKANHENQSERLRQQQMMERQQQELSLQARLAKKRAQKLANAGSETKDEPTAVVDEAQLLEEERAERELLVKQRDEEDEAALAELKEKQRGEVAAIMLNLDEDAERRRAAALLQQQEAEHQLQRLQQEHRESLETLNVSLATQKMQQEGKLQQRLLGRRAKKQEELSRLHVSVEEAAKALRELDEEQAAQRARFEHEWESEIVRKLADETEQQRSKELEITRVLNQAALEAAAADAARKALETVNRLEIERIAAEFQSETAAARLQQSVDAESQRKRLQDRLAEKKQKKQKKAAQWLKPTDSAGNEATGDSQASEAEAQLKREQDAAEAAARKKQEDACELQQQTVKELERLKEEHENEMKNLNASLLADQRRQEQKLQERIAQRRERKLKDAASSEGEKERLAQLEEEERVEQQALEVELAAKAAQRIQEETERQRLKEAELAARIDQAATEAAAAETARKAMEAARELEIARLSKEFDEKSRELQRSNQADLVTQKKKLEARIAAKKQKKLMELEAKKELELQKLKEQQAKALEAMEEDKNKVMDALEVLVVGDAAGDESLPGGEEGGEPSQVIESPQLVSGTEVTQSRVPQQTPSSADTQQQEARDITAIEQLFTLGLIPLQLSLMAGIELAVSQRHQAEASSLMAAQYDEKMVAIRLGMSDVLQQKAAAKALAMSNPHSQPQEKDAQLQEIDKEFDLKIREKEQRLLADVEHAQHVQTKALKDQQLAQIAFLLSHFAPQHALAVTKFNTQQQTSGHGKPPQQQQQIGQTAFVSKAEREDADLVNALRAQLQVEKNERIRELSDEKQVELLKIDEQLTNELTELETRFNVLIELEKAEINKTFANRLEQLQKSAGRVSKADEAQRTKFQTEKDAQLSRLVLMLRGRQAKQIERLKKLAQRRREMLEDEFARKVLVVTAQSMQRVVDEKETLAKKQAMLKKNESERADLSSESGGGGVLLTQALEERLVKIEGMLRDRLQSACGSIRDPADSKADLETDNNSDSTPDASMAVALYRKTIKDAISRGCRTEKEFLLPSASEMTADRLKVLRADHVPLEKMNANMRTRLDFVKFMLQLATPSPSLPAATEHQKLPHVVIVKSLLSEGSDPKTSSLSAYVDNASQTLFLPAAYLHEISSGQLAILALHALAQAQTQCVDVSDPIFISTVYELLVRCYQNLFQSKQQQTESVEPQVSSASRSVGLQPALSTATAVSSRQWHSRLHEMESFLTSLERTETLSASSSGAGLPLPGAAMSGLERMASLKRLSPSLGSSASSRSLLGKKSPSELELFVIHERKQLLHEKLDTAEKLYTQVLRQYQEQKESLEYMQEMLTEEQEDHASGNASAQTQSEVAELEAALALTRKERDELFAQCQALRDALAQQAPTPR